MGRKREVSCVLCQRCEETKITGALSTKDQVTAHQNCLLFASGIYCSDSPLLDDLFGFSVKDVLDEVKRGSKLMCSSCKRKGATAGCEVKRCKKSYHYPCAVQEGAKAIEDEAMEKYELYCDKHYQQKHGNDGAISGQASSFTKPQTSKNPSGAGSSKVYCLACEKTSQIISLESSSNSIIMLCCEKHAPSSHKGNASDDSAAAGPSACSSDSNSSNRMPPSFLKRRLSFNDKEEDPPSKRKSDGWKRRISDNSSNSDENELNTAMALFAPIESDLDESANSVPESQLIGNHTESLTGSTSGNQPEDESRDRNIDDDEIIIHSHAESKSLLLPVEICMESQSLSVTSDKLSQTVSTADPSVRAEEVVKSEALPSEPKPSINSASFWKSCNAAGCTQAIFTDFITELNDISSRIQSDQASQKDYDLSLTVMSASGKLAELVTKQQKELQRKQTELRKATKAMNDVVSALSR